MRLRIGAFAVVCLYAAACSPGSEPTAGGAPAGTAPAGEWRTLFDGTSLDGWARVGGDANWQIADGAVQADGGTGFLLTSSVYADFDLELEFWVSPDANSGVFIRCANPAEIGAATCYEVNIFDKRPDPAYRTGAIVDVAQPSVMLDTGDRWNKYEISARGRHLTVKLNDQTTVDVEDDRFAAGPIALQYGAGRVKFRNVRIRAE
jgi:3-keto-disaccharide hydrolase